MIRIFFILVLLLLAIASPLELRAQMVPAGRGSLISGSVLSGDQVWLISARDEDACSCGVLRCLEFSGARWCESNCHSMSSGWHPAGSTFVFVHGYNTSLEGAQERGIQVYSNLFQQCEARPPVRFVIWAWRSDREKLRRVRDYTLKSERAIELGEKFARSLNRLGPNPPVVLGYSLGSQVAISGLTQTNGYQGTPVSLAVIAAASDCSFGSCTIGLRNSRSIGMTLVFVNDQDRAIRAANLICRAKFGSQYQAFEDLATVNQSHLGHLEFVDITGIASKRHSIVRYTSLDIVRRELVELVNSSTGSWPVLSTEPFATLPEHPGTPIQEKHTATSESKSRRAEVR